MKAGAVTRAGGLRPRAKQALINFKWGSCSHQCWQGRMQIAAQESYEGLFAYSAAAAHGGSSTRCLGPKSFRKLCNHGREQLKDVARMYFLPRSSSTV